MILGSGPENREKQNVNHDGIEFVCKDDLHDKSMLSPPVVQNRLQHQFRSRRTSAAPEDRNSD